MDYILKGFVDVLNPGTILWVAIGVTIGYLVGALPGLGKATGVAVSIPLTFYLSPVAALGMLIGIAKGSAAGSAVSAILLNMLGEPASAPTALDGYPLARQGKAQKALKMGLYASVAGDFLSTLVLIGLAAPLASYALLIGPVELCAILLFSLTFIGGLSGQVADQGAHRGGLRRLLRHRRDRDRDVRPADDLRPSGARGRHQARADGNRHAGGRRDDRAGRQHQDHRRGVRADQGWARRARTG